MKTVGSFAVLATAALVTGYGNGTGPGLQVSLSFATRAPGTTAAPAFSVTGVLSDTVRSGNDVLVISQAQIVLRRIKVKLQETPLVISGSTSTNVAIRVVVRD